MRISALIALLALSLGVGTCRRSPRAGLNVTPPKLSSAPITADKQTRPDFDKEIKPILQSRCMPCHFNGGKVYEKLPFDQPATIVKLDEKLFTRIKDKKEQRLIREFLAQP